MSTFTLAICAALMQSTIEKAVVSTPEGRKQVFEHLDRKFQAGEKTYHELAGFREKLRWLDKIDAAINVKRMAAESIQDDEKRRKAFEEISKESAELSKLSKALKREFEGIERRALSGKKNSPPRKR